MSKQRGGTEPHITEDRSELLDFSTFIAKICTYNTLGFICLSGSAVPHPSAAPGCGVSRAWLVSPRARVAAEAGLGTPLLSSVAILRAA